MRNQRQKPTAIKALLFAALLLAAASAWAGQVAGSVVRLSGPLLARKADGTVRVLALKSEVESGDTLVSEKNTYAQLRFIDNSEITLRPGTTFKIEDFAYDAGKPEADSAVFSLVKGGLRSITGLLGKRNKEKFSMKTPSATIGIRGTTFVINYVPSPLDAQRGLTSTTGAGGKLARGADGPASPPDAKVTPGGAAGAGGSVASPQGILGQLRDPAAAGAGAPQPNGGHLPVSSEQALADATAILLSGSLNGQGSNQPPAAPALPAVLPAVLTPPVLPPASPTPPALPPGLHLQVLDGMIVVTNNGGSQGFQAGQFGYVPNPSQPPVIVPPNPGIQFVPPPSFNVGATGPVASGGTQERGAVDCIVR
jgi:hypothetical protein